MKKKIKQKIIRLYHKLNYPGSFGGVDAFRKALKDNDNIDVSRKMLRNILLSSELYATSMRVPSKFLRRSVRAEGVNIEAAMDIFYIKVLEKTYYVLLVVGKCGGGGEKFRSNID